MDRFEIQLQQGWDVIGSDGEKVGDIDAVEADHIVVRKGFFFPSDHYIPLDAISSAEEGAVYLNVTKDDAMNQSWDTAPAAAGTAGTYEGGYVADVDRDSAYVQDEVVTGEAPLLDGAYTSEIDSNDPVYNDTNRAGYVEDVDRAGYANEVREGDDHTTIERAEEHLDVNKREVDLGSVQVEKTVHEVEQSIDVPVREEEVHIERRSVDRDVDGTHVFEEGTIEVPVRGEEVEVEKHARVVEEIDIDKTAEEHTERVTDTVRREEVNVNDATGTRNYEGDRAYGDDDRSLLDKTKDALDTDDDGKVGR